MLRSKLAELNRHIDVTERRVVQQRVSIDRLATLGRSTTETKKLLGELQYHLDTMTERRRRLLSGHGRKTL